MPPEALAAFGTRVGFPFSKGSTIRNTLRVWIEVFSEDLSGLSFIVGHLLPAQGLHPGRVLWIL